MYYIMMKTHNENISQQKRQQTYLKGLFTEFNETPRGLKFCNGVQGRVALMLDMMMLWLMFEDKLQMNSVSATIQV